MDHARQVLYVSDQITMFCDRHRDAGDVGFLESVRSDQAGDYVPGNDDERNRIHIGCRDSRHGIGSSRTGSCDADTDFAACTSITVCCMNRSLLMSCQQVMEISESVQRIVNI